MPAHKSPDPQVPASFSIARSKMDDIERRATAEGVSKGKWIRQAVEAALAPVKRDPAAVMAGVDAQRDLAARLNTIMPPAPKAQAPLRASTACLHPMYRRMKGQCLSCGEKIH